MKRFAQMTASMGNNMAFPLKKTLVVNPQNALIKNAFKLWEGDKKDLARKLGIHVMDLAAISSEGLKPEEKENFVKRSQDILSELSNLAL